MDVDECLFGANVMQTFSLQDTGQANYLLEVKIHSYSNPSHHDANGDCCDYWSDCDFISNLSIQLRSRSPKTSDCPLGL